MLRTRPLLRVAVLALVAALLALAACSGDEKKASPSTTRRTTTTTSTSTTTTTTTAPPPSATAPLTGLPASDSSVDLRRPALAVKIDNSPEAMPQEGINQADVVFEIMVEGISRLMAVFHSVDAGEIGPTRSARYSDPPILALLGKPLFGWSGAAGGVEKDVYNSSWIVNVNWDRVKNSDYYRKKGRAAPHNLYTSTRTLYSYAEPDQPPPLPLFPYLGAGESNAGGSPLAGMQMKVGDTPSAWAWDAAGNHWVRWQYGKRDLTDAGPQADAQNVVILEIKYKGSRMAPIAVLDGQGTAIVMSGGQAYRGTWSRQDQLHPVVLTGADNLPMKLAPGRTWVELTNGSTASPLSPEAVAALPKG